MTDEVPEQTGHEHPGPERPDPAHRKPWAGPARRRGLIAGATAAALLVVGIAGGAAGAVLLRPAPQTYDASLATTQVASLSSGQSVAIDGKVVEIFGNKFVVDDGTARALVETGRAGEGGKLVAAGEIVTVQGRFEHGFMHASALKHADGEIEELAPPPPAGPPPLPGPPPPARP